MQSEKVSVVTGGKRNEPAKPSRHVVFVFGPDARPRISGLIAAGTFAGKADHGFRMPTEPATAKPKSLKPATANAGR